MNLPSDNEDCRNQACCVYCGEAMADENPVFIGGEPLHRCCADHYSEEMDKLDEIVERNAEQMVWVDAEGESFASRWDDDPSPYDGTYSED